MPGLTLVRSAANARNLQGVQWKSFSEQATHTALSPQANDAATAQMNSRYRGAITICSRDSVRLP